MEIYLSSSWKNRTRVRALAEKLREQHFSVYDFTDPACRTTPEIPPEKYLEQFDPETITYREYLAAVPEWYEAIMGNKRAIEQCSVVVLVLPCGNDSHGDAYYGLGLGKRLVVCGQPEAGERTIVHLWAEAILDQDDDAVEYLRKCSHLPSGQREIRLPLMILHSFSPTNGES